MLDENVVVVGILVVGLAVPLNHGPENLRLLCFKIFVKAILLVPLKQGGYFKTIILVQ